MLAKLKLRTIARVFDEVCERAQAEKIGYSEFMRRLLDCELLGRSERSVQERIRQAHFPVVRTVEQFNFGFQPSLDERQIRELFDTCAFVKQSVNLLFLGQAGTGKTHLSLALALRAVQLGYRALFVTAGEMVQDLFASLADGTLRRRIKRYTRPDLLVVDEVGFQSLPAEKGALFFEVVSRRYEKGSIVLTSNKSLEDWAKLFNDATLASACLDRLLHHAKVFTIAGPSYRLKGPNSKAA